MAKFTFGMLVSRSERRKDTAGRQEQKRLLEANLARLGGRALESADVTLPEVAREMLDKYSIAPRIPGHNKRELMHTTTFHEGKVAFGDDSNDNTGRIIHPNNGVCAVISQRGGDVATIVNVVALTKGSGKSPVAFTRTVVSGLYSDTPTVGAPEILEGVPSYDIEQDGIDFIKVAPKGIGEYSRVADRVPEQLLPESALTPAQRHELAFMATAIDLVRSPELVA